jgi:hypothetical protein
LARHGDFALRVLQQLLIEGYHMIRNNLTQRTVFACATLAVSFALAPSLSAAEDKKPTAPSSTVSPEQRSKDAEKSTDMKRTDCKKIYRLVHRGPPGKGVDTMVLDRIECPLART